MKSLANYFSSRKKDRVLELLINHSVHCVNVGETLTRISLLWTKRQGASAETSVALIETEEKSADSIEQEVILELVSAELPLKLKEEFLNFVQLLDKSAGGAKRAGKNMSLLLDFPLPTQYAEILIHECELIKESFELIKSALENLNDEDFVRKKVLRVSELESQMDKYYLEMKRGYFDLEKSFNSAAALLILDHVTRDLELAADLSEDAADILLKIVSVSK